MMMHIITRSPYSSTALEECLNFADEQSVLLLLGDAVYATSHPGLSAFNNLKTYAIEEDCGARGLEKKDTIEYIDYLEMIKLTETHHPIQTWS